MPVTRSSSRPNSQQPANHPYSTRRAGSSSNGDPKKTSKPPSNEIIVLSSDDDEPPPKGTLLQKKTSSRTSKKKGASSAAPPVHSGDVLEISSDDESHSKRPSTRKQAEAPNVKDLQRTIRKLQEELARSEKRAETSSREVEELKRNCSNEEVLSGLGDYVSCEVCTHTMWCPYTLPQCGHSFCEACLVDWFSTTQAQHMTANAHLDDNRTALAGQLRNFVQMVPNLHAYGPQGQVHVRAILAEVRRHRPEYTCPSCRKEVLNTPVENFPLKDLIGEVAERMGEKNTHKGMASRRGSGPFDHFFAAPI